MPAAPPPISPRAGPSADGSPMAMYQGLRVFSYVVLGLMSGGIVYGAYIAITYWTGISV